MTIRRGLDTTVSLLVIVGFGGGGTAVGAVIGGVPGGFVGGLFAFTGGVLLTFLQKRASARKEEHATLARLRRVVRPAGAAAEAGTSPGILLRAEEGVVDFVDRPELSELEECCREEAQFRLMLITGPGGVGKTRLALELAYRLGEGWSSWSVPRGGEDAVPALLASTRSDLLLIVDYAETRADLKSLLRTASAGLGRRVRVLLVARAAGEWWRMLAEDKDVRDALANYRRCLLGPVQDKAVIAAALSSFAARLGVDVGETVAIEPPDRPVPILVLQAAALLAVLDARARETREVRRVAFDDNVLADLLNHERGYLLASARSRGLLAPDGGLDTVPLERSVAVACLFGAASEAEASDILARLPDLSDAPALLRGRLARWIRELYPASSHPQERWWSTLQPDLLAELYVVEQLGTLDDGAVAGLFRDIGATRAREAFTVLGRADSHHPADAKAIAAAALQSDLANLAPAAIDVSLQTGGPFPGLLVGLLGDADLSRDDFARIAEAIPRPTIRLAIAALAATERVAAATEPQDDPRLWARWQFLLGRRAHDAGQPMKARRAATQAVRIYRRLHADQPGEYQAQLAESLRLLGETNAALGQPAQAVEAIEDAVASYRELFEASPDAYRADLAASLVALSEFWPLTGQPDDERAAEALALFRGVVDAHPDHVNAEVGQALRGIAKCQWMLGQADDALRAANEEVSVFRALCATNPDQFVASLVPALHDLGAMWSEIARASPGIGVMSYFRRALRLAEEAVTRSRTMAEFNPDQFRPLLAQALLTLANQKSALRDSAEALALTEEAVDVYRESVKIIPDRYLPDLAYALIPLAICSMTVNHTERALAAAEEGIGIYRKLFRANTRRYRDEFIFALRTAEGIYDTAREPAQVRRIQAELNTVEQTPTAAG